VAGHRLSSGQLEAVLAAHPAVAECAVIGISDPLKGQVPRALVVTKSDFTGDAEQLAAELASRIRTEVGAIATLSQVDVVSGLPKTRSGKILRRTMRQLADGVDAPVPSTIEDVAVLDRLRDVL
jgi:propionyl-CoA synthetase